MSEYRRERKRERSEREKESEQERERSCDEVLGKWRICLAYGESLSLPHKALLRVIHLSLSLSFSFSLTAYFLPLSDSFEKLLSSLFDSSLFLVVFLFYFPRGNEIHSRKKADSRRCRGRSFQTLVKTSSKKLARSN